LSIEPEVRGNRVCGQTYIQSFHEGNGITPISGKFRPEMNSCSVLLSAQKNQGGPVSVYYTKRSFMMKKRILFTGMVMMLALSLAFLTGCPTEAAEEGNLTGLENWVYGGETPQSPNPGWLTITFQKNNKVICAFSHDGTTNEWNYSYDKGTRAGTISRSGGGWTPGDFTISGDGKTLTFNNFMGAARNYKRLRSGDGLDPVPFAPGALPADLLGTVWGGETPRGEEDWATFTFRADGKAIASFAIDNSTNEWEFTYTDSLKSGSFSGGGLTAFTISADGTTLIINPYYAHGFREFKRFR
jgi:hypothetical protein